MAGNENISNAVHNNKPVPPPKPISPPYRMPPQPPAAAGSNIYGEPSNIPGAATSSTNELPNGISSNITLRAHSSKFPVSSI